MHPSKHLYLNIQCIKSLWFANKRKRPKSATAGTYLTQGKKYQMKLKKMGDQLQTR